MYAFVNTGGCSNILTIPEHTPIEWQQDKKRKLVNFVVKYSSKYPVVRMMTEVLFKIVLTKLYY